MYLQEQLRVMGSGGLQLEEIAIEENSQTGVTSLRIELSYDPAIQLLGIYPDKAFTGKDNYTTMFIAALVIVAKTWKQPKCPLTDE